MKSSWGRHLELWVMMTLLLLTCIPRLRAQESNAKTDAQAISKTGLLPVYGVDFAFDATWVDGAQFPSQSANHPKFGVSAAFQQVWDALKVGGFSTLRFPVDVRDAKGAAGRVANLCVWAKNNNVKLVPILLGSDRGHPLASDYSANVSAFNRALFTALRDGQRLEVYPQILAYQLENEMNHAGLHGAMPAESAQLRLLQAAGSLRKAEQESLKDTGFNPTPLMVNASFDYELVKKRAMAGATLSDDAYEKAYESLKQFLMGVAISSDIDAFSVGWYAGSLSSGSVDKFPILLRALVSDITGKQVLFTTGFSTGFRSADEQKDFYRIAFSNLADYRASEGVDSHFIGVFFREAVNGKESNPSPPTPATASEVGKWDRSAKSDELARMWSGQATSEALVWWSKKVESNFGLLTVKLDSAGKATVTPQPAQEALAQVANAVSQANSEVSKETTNLQTNQTAPPTENSIDPPPTDQPPTDPTGSESGSSLKEKVKQGLIDLLGSAFQRLGTFISGTNSGSDGGGDPGGDPGGIMFAPEDVTIPQSFRVEQQATFSVTLRNEGTAEASNLIVALYGEDNTPLGESAAINVPAGSTRTAKVYWTPAESKASYSISVKVADGLGDEIAAVALDPISIIGPTDPGDSTPGSGDTRTASKRGDTLTDITDGPSAMKVQLPLGSPQVRALTVGAPGQVLAAGQASSVMLSMVNPYGRALTDINATLLVDGKAGETKTVSALLSKQSRSLLFAGVRFSQAGRHEVKIVLESTGSKPIRGSVSKHVEVERYTDRRLTKPDGLKTVSTAGSGTKIFVRPILPPSVKVRGLEAPTTQVGSMSPPITPGGRTMTPTAPLRPVGGNTKSTPTKPVGDPPRVREGEVRDLNLAGASAPDLSVSDIRYSPASPRAGDLLTFAITVRNIGRADAKGAKVVCVLYIDGREAVTKEFTADIKAHDTFNEQWRTSMPLARQQVGLIVSATIANDASGANNQAGIKINSSTRPSRPDRSQPDRAVVPPPTRPVKPPTDRPTKPPPSNTSPTAPRSGEAPPKQKPGATKRPIAQQGALRGLSGSARICISA